MILREPTASDAGAIAALSSELGYVATADTIRERLEALAGRTDQRVWVAVVADGVAGWAQAQASVVLGSGFRVEIVGLVVGQTFRRCGVGRRLVEEIERWSAQLGASTVTVRSKVTRQESHRFYPALGYDAVKNQTVYRKRLSARP